MMKTKLTILTLSLLAASTLQAAPPANDSILKAIEHSGNYAALPLQDLSTATADPMDPLISGASVGKTLWYKFPKVAGTIEYRITFQSQTATGTAAFYTALDPENPRGSLNSVGNPVPFTTGQTLLLNLLPDGKPLYLMMAGTGTFDITFRFVSAQEPNDFIAYAYNLTGERGTISATNRLCSITADEPPLPVSAVPMTNTVWFKWTPNFTGLAGFDTNFSYLGYSPTPSSQPNYDLDNYLHHTQIALYSSTGPVTNPTLYPLQSNATGGFRQINSRLTYTVVSGTTYYIAVGTATGASGSIQLQYYRANTSGEIYLVHPDLGSCDESTSEYDIYVYRRYVGTGTASCLFATSNDTATANSDYGPRTPTLNFANPSFGPSDDCWVQRVTIPIFQDTLTENLIEKFDVTISGGAASGSSGYTTGKFSIYDDESGTAQDVVISDSRPSIKEGGVVRLYAQRVNASSGIQYYLYQAQSSGDAIQDIDFELGSSIMKPNEVSAPVDFRTTDDSLFEPDEIAYVRVADQFTYVATIIDDDPYIPVAGRLIASLPYANNSRHALVNATISPYGAVSGKVVLVGQTLPFSGRLDSRGKLQVMLTPKRRGLFQLTLAAQDANGKFRLTLLDSNTTSATTATAIIQNYSSRSNPCPLAASYTISQDSTSIGFDSIYCTGATICRIDKAGNARFIGRIFDGTPYTIAGYVDGAGLANAITTLYGGSGHIAFYGDVPKASGSTTNLYISISKPGRIGTSVGNQALSQTFTGLMAPYTPPASGERMLESWSSGNGSVELFCPPLFSTKTKTMTVSTSNVASVPTDTEKVKITLSPSSGLFTGSFVLPNTSQVLKFYGVVTDLPGLNGSGKGFFYNGKLGGRIRLAKP